MPRDGPAKRAGRLRPPPVALGDAIAFFVSFVAFVRFVVPGARSQRD